jgi:hypothetical protein
MDFSNQVSSDNLMALMHQTDSVLTDANSVGDFVVFVKVDMDTYVGFDTPLRNIPKSGANTAPGNLIASGWEAVTSTNN